MSACFPWSPRKQTWVMTEWLLSRPLDQLTEKNESQIPHCLYTLTVACTASSISRYWIGIWDGLEIAAFSDGHCCHPLKANTLQGQGAASWRRAVTQQPAVVGGSRPRCPLPLASPSNADERSRGSAQPFPLLLFLHKLFFRSGINARESG